MSSNTLRGVGQEGRRRRGDGKGENEGQNAPGLRRRRSTWRGGPGGPHGGGRRLGADARTAQDSFAGFHRARDAFPRFQRARGAAVAGRQGPQPGGDDAGDDGAKYSQARCGDAGRSRVGGFDGRPGAGTVQGRDVHLPVELQRRAGVIAMPGSSLPAHHDAAPKSVEHSEPTIADPVRAPHGTRDVMSHGPWYEQEPAGAEAFDDPKPNLIGRVAIGAAIAASLSVVLFAIVRVRAQNAAQEADAPQVEAPLVQRGLPGTSASAETPPAPPTAGTPSPPPYPGGLPADQPARSLSARAGNRFRPLRRCVGGRVRPERATGHHLPLAPPRSHRRRIVRASTAPRPGAAAEQRGVPPREFVPTEGAGRQRSRPFAPHRRQSRRPRGSHAAATGPFRRSQQSVPAAETAPANPSPARPGTAGDMPAGTTRPGPKRRTIPTRLCR